jgi:hypothetical protein
MKKIGLYILFLPVIVGYGSKVNSVDTSQDLLGFKVMQIDQSINDLSNSLVLILLLVTLIFVLLFGIAVCYVLQKLIRIGYAYREFISNRWIDEPDVHARKVEETDLNLAMFTEQQWELSELLSQGHEDGDSHDFVDLPHDW